VFGFVIAVVIFFGPNLMAEVDNYIPANPMATPTHIVANWYLAPFYAILRAVPDKLGGVALMFSAILILFGFVIAVVYFLYGLNLLYFN